MLYLGVSFADATIYGVFDQAYQSNKTTVGTTPAVTDKGISGTLNGGNALGFKGNEDLGNGIKASFLIEFGMESSDAMAGVSNRQSFLGLDGGFGSITVGKQYSEVFNAACGFDLGGCAAMVGSLPLIIISDEDSDVRRSNQVNYKLPQFVDGLSINIGKSYGEADVVSSGAGNKNAGDGTNYSISYRTGGFAGTIASETLDNTGSFAVLQNVPTALTTAKKKTSVTGLSYDISGMAKVAYTSAKTTIGSGQTVKGNSIGVSVPLGAATIAFETGTGDTKGAASATTSKLKASQLAFNYALSKRTLAYFRQGSHTETTSTATNAFKLSTTAFGVLHSF